MDKPTFTTSILDLIRQRTSRRSYLKKPLSEQHQKQLREFMERENTGPFGNKVRFALIAAEEGDNKILKGLGTYGFIKNPQAFFLGAVEDTEKSLEDFGYVFEKVILYATELDLGTCWMGASFKRNKFSDRISVAETEMIPAVSPIGYFNANKRGRLDSIVRWAAKSKKRRPWEKLFFKTSATQPLSEEEAGAYSVPLEMVRLGPSASNKQPWRIFKDNDSNLFHLFLYRNKKYEKSYRMMGTVDLQRLDMGIAMCHFELAAREEGLKGSWQKHPTEIKELPEYAEYVISWEGQNT